MQSNRMKGSWLRRVLAAVLAISMVVIPVNFPGSASAASGALVEYTSPNLFADDFISDQSLTGVKYKWNFNHDVYNYGLTTIGDYSTYVGGYTKNWLKLKATDAKGNDVSANWTNYTFELDVRREDATTTADNIYVLGRYIEGRGGYAMEFDGGNFTLWTIDKDDFMVRLKDWGSDIGNREFGGWAHLKMTFRGNKISIILTGNREDGTPVETVYDFTDNTYSRGGVAVLTDRSTSLNSNWTAHYKNPKLTMDNGTVAYSGGIEIGKPKTINSTTFTWEEKFGNKSNYSVPGGQLMIDMGPKDGEVDENGKKGAYRTLLTLSAETYNAETRKMVDLSQGWQNYSVELTVTGFRPWGNGPVGIMGRVYWDGKSIPYSYSFVEKGDRYMLQKTYYDETGKAHLETVILQQRNAGVARPDEREHSTLGNGKRTRLKMEFVDNVIRCYVNGEIYIEYVDTGEFGDPIPYGGVGIFQMGRGWKSLVDDFLFTPSGDTTSFFDDFSDDRYFRGMYYQMETTEEPDKEDVTYNWTTPHPLKFEDGAFKVDTTKMMHSWSFLNGVAESGLDFDQTWINYTVEADFKRDGGEDLRKYDRMRLCGRVTDQGFFAVQWNGELDLYWIDADGTEHRLTNKGTHLPLNYSGWVHLFLSFKEETVTYGLSALDENGEIKEWSFQATEKQLEGIPVVMQGGIGFGIDRYNVTNDWAAYIKNIKVTMEDGTVTYEDPFDEAQPDPALTATYNWTEKSQSASKFEIKDGTCQYVTTLSSNDTIAYLEGVLDDGTNVFDRWTNYTVEADVRRENANEAESVYIMGRVNGDDKYYALGYNGSDLYLLRVDGNHDSAATKCRLANKGTSVPGGRAYEGWAHIWMTFEGNTITYGISFKNEDGTLATYQWSYIETGVCPQHKDTPIDCCSTSYASGGIGIRIEGSYQDLGPDRVANSGDEDGPWIGYIDNLKVTWMDGTVAYYDEFNTVPDSLRQDAIYKWNQTTPAGNTAGTADGVYTSSVKANTKNYAILTGVAEDNANATVGWKNYIVEADVTRVGAASVADSFYLLGRMGANGGYGFKFSGSTVALCKVSTNGQATVIQEKGSMIGGVTFGDKVHMKMAMVGKRITLTLTGKDGNGIDVITEYTFTDNTFTAGSIGLLVEGTAAWTVKVDNIKVTLSDGTVAYLDTMESARSQYTHYSWTQVSSQFVLSSGIVTNGTEKYFSMTMNHDSGENGLFLNGTVNGESVSQNWADYTVGAKIRRDAPSNLTGNGIVGRMSLVDPSNPSKGYVGYEVMLRGDSLDIYKHYIDENGARVRSNRYYLLVGTAPKSEWIYMTASFVGKTITVKLYEIEEDGSMTLMKPSANQVWTDDEYLSPAIMTGGVALVTHKSNMMPKGEYPDRFIADYDDVSVYAVENGVEADLLFYEDFSDDKFFNDGADYVPAEPEGGFANGFNSNGIKVESGYLPELPAGKYENGFNITGIVIDNAWTPPLVTANANNAFYPEGRVVEDGYTVPLISNWTVVNGSLYKTDTDNYPQMLNVNDGIADYAQQWKEYSTEVDIMLTSEQSVAGVVFAANNTGFYELRMDGDKVYLLHSASNTALMEKDLTLNLNKWHYVKIELSSSKITCYINGSLVFTHTATKTLAGSVGLRAVCNVRFDNIAVYPNSEADHRKFRSYQFEAEKASDLDSVWTFDDASKWSIANRLLSYTGTGMGKTVLRNKNALKNYYVEVAGTPKTQTAVMGVMGRVNGNSGYTLTMDVAKGLILYRNGVKIGSVSKDDLYLKGVMLLPNHEYTLRLDMYDGSIRCFINGVRALQVKDNNPLSAGSIGITQSKDVNTRAVTTGVTAGDVKLSFVDFDGKEHKTFTVTPGKVPDIKQMYLKVDKGDGNPTLVLLDMVMDDSKFDENAKGTVTIPVEYEGSVINFTYKVVERPEYIKKLNADIAKLDVETVTEEQYNEIYARFNDLSFVEKPSITEENQQKLKDARHKVLTTLHPMLLDYELVYEESFDTRDVIDDFRTGKMVTGSRNSGNWYVENGILHQYLADDGARHSSGHARLISNKHYQVRYFSADFMVYDGLTWAGIVLHADNKTNDDLTFFVSDKYEGYNGNRIRLMKNWQITCGSTILQKELEDEEMYQLEPYTWYNLKMIITEDHYIRCYLNGQMFLEYKDVATPGYPNVFDTGAIGLGSWEGFHAFDNIVVYGTEVEADIYQHINTDLESKVWEDDFQDEKANAGKDPSHWIENSLTDKWKVKVSGSNVFYGSKDNLETASQTWLHVFESEIDYSAQMRITKQGDYPTLGLTARVSMRDSFIHAGYDMYLKKWFVQYQKAANWEVKTIYDDEVDNDVDFSNWVTVRVKIVDDMLELYKGNKLMMTVNVEDRPGVGRVGIFTERCNVDIDNVKLNQLSGQGTVQDGVLQYYLTDMGFAASMYQVYEMPNGDLVLNSDNGVSKDGGATFQKSTEYSNKRIASTTRLRNGNYMTITNGTVKNDDGTTDAIMTAVYGIVGADGKITWETRGQLYAEPNTRYAQPEGHINEVELADGKLRIFYCIGPNHGEIQNLDSTAVSCSETYYTDDYGKTWHLNEVSTADVIGQTLFFESHVISITKDTHDLLGNFLPKGTLVHYSNYCTREFMSYTLSFDGGVTWEGDYSIPYMPCPRGSFAIIEDPYERGTYYMNMFYGARNKQASGDCRYHIVLARSYDGITWNYLCDVDRWDIDSGGDTRGLFHATNAYIGISKDYVFPEFGRNEKWQASYNILRPVINRFEKSKLVDQPWPQEYVIEDKAIVYVEAQASRTVFPKFGEFTLEGAKLLVHYYDGTTDSLDLAELYEQNRIKLVAPKLEEEGTERVKVVYNAYAAVYEVTVTSGHEGGTATCTDRAICDLCGQPYGRTLDHTVEFVKGYEATETTNGMADHYACTACHGTFSDAEGKRKFDAVIPAWVQVEDGEATVDDIMVDKIIDNAADEIVLNLNYEDKFVQDVVFTGEAFKEAAKEGKPFKIVTSELTITFDATAVQAIADALNKRNDVTISVKFVDAGELNESQAAALNGANVQKILSAQVTSKGKVISDFGGGAVTIRIPGAKDLQLWYLGDDGTVENMYVTFDGEDMVVELYHFSLYATVSVESNVGLIILIVVLAVLVALVAVVFLVPPVRKKVFGLFQKKKEELPEPEAAEAETTNE